jgi:hypothetical protein
MCIYTYCPYRRRRKFNTKTTLALLDFVPWTVGLLGAKGEI